MATCNFCKNEAVYAFKNFGAGTFLGLASGGRAFAEDGTQLEPISVLYGCEDHNQNVYDAAIAHSKKEYISNFKPK